MSNDRFKFRTPVFIGDIFKKYVYWDAEDGRPTNIEMFGDSPTAFCCGDDEQCLGLRDKNRNLIYEGDWLLDNNNNKHLVMFLGSPASFAYCKEEDTRYACTFFQKNADKMEIIGNVHEQGVK